MEGRGRDLFSSQLGMIQNLIRAISRNGRLTHEDAADFASFVMLKLIEKDYARLRKFKGRSTLRTYLTVVIQRLLLDYRTAKLGKWRPSMRARRLGAVAMKLEELLWRDGYTFQEAVHVLHWNWQVALDREALWCLATHLPPRRSGKLVGLETARELAVSTGTPAADLEDRELSNALLAAISKGLSSLSDTERLALQLRFERGLTAQEIGAHLHLPPQAVYRQVERSLKRLRKRLERNGVRENHVRRVLASRRREFTFLGRVPAAPAPADA
ncbi:MAG TPA: sigma-70 family RNA polymerase sigma factor [Vicinamibacteria bacterium]|nr:sigma-70 family RNA polymerase sigma factor [Vicinamibacteria bacterium]